MKKQLLLGTTNQAKVNIIRAALQSLPVELVTLAELNIKITVREDGHSTKENAGKKARAYFAESHIPTLAIDGGLHIHQFPPEKQPGVLIRRIHADREASDEEIQDYYTRELDKVGGESMATWKGAIALVVSDQTVYCDTFSYETILTSRKKGGVISGSPLSSLTIDPVTGKYHSELAWAERPSEAAYQHATP